MKEKRIMSVREIGLTQLEAAELLATTNMSISRQERGENKRGPITGALEYLIASWPELDEEQRQRIRQRLDIMRNR